MMAFDKPMSEMGEAFVEVVGEMVAFPEMVGGLGVLCQLYFK